MVKSRKEYKIPFRSCVYSKTLSLIGVIECDKMICPSNSVGCSVTSETTNDLINIETIRKCYDTQGNVVYDSGSDFMATLSYKYT